MTTLKLRDQRPALRLLEEGDAGAKGPHERLAHDPWAKLGHEGALRACQANGWAGALMVLLSEGLPEEAAA